MNIANIFSVLLFILLLCSHMVASGQVKTQDPLRVGVAGLVHGHVGWVFESHKRGDIEIIGIAEPNAELAQQYLKRYNLPASLVFPTLDDMLAIFMV